MLKRALMELTPEVLRDIGPLFDAGLTVVQSLDGYHPSGDPVARLIVAGDALPDECSVDAPGQLLTVTAEFTTEAYGRQRMVKLSALRVVTVREWSRGGRDLTVVEGA